MKKDKYIKRMAKHEKSFDKLWSKIADDTNEFIKENPKKTMYDLKFIENFSDSMALSAAWIQDRLNGKDAKTRGSLTKKIRKVLDYTYY